MTVRNSNSALTPATHKRRKCAYSAELVLHISVAMEVRDLGKRPEGEQSLDLCLEASGKQRFSAVPGGLPSACANGRADARRKCVERYGHVAMRFGADAGWYCGKFIGWPRKKSERLCTKEAVNAVMHFDGEARPDVYRLTFSLYVAESDRDSPKWGEHGWFFCRGRFH